MKITIFVDAGERDRLRAELAEVTAERERLRNTIAAAGQSTMDWAEYARQGWAEVERLRRALDGARQVIRTNPDMKLSWVPTDRLADYRAAARQEGAADALEDATRRINWTRVSGYHDVARQLRRLAAEIRSGERDVPVLRGDLGQPQEEE